MLTLIHSLCKTKTNKCKKTPLQLIKYAIMGYKGKGKGKGNETAQ